MTYFSRSPTLITYRDSKKVTITAGNKEKDYWVYGIKEGSRNYQAQRQGLLLDVISLNPGIQHTHLIQIVYELSKMAKKTIEKELNRLEENQILESVKKGDSPNAIRKWIIHAPESNIEKGAKKHVENIVKSVEKYVSRIERIYPKLNDAQKAWSMMYLFQVIYHFQPIIEIINLDFNISKNITRFDRLVTRAYKILETKERNYFDAWLILRRLLDLRSSQPMIEMNNFLSEI